MTRKESYIAAASLCTAAAVIAAVYWAQQTQPPPPPPGTDEFVALSMGSARDRDQALLAVLEHWQDEFAPFLVEALARSQDEAYRIKVARFLNRRFNVKLGANSTRWRRWLWKTRLDLPPSYAAFRATLASFQGDLPASFFQPGRPAKIRLDEVLWVGGNPYFVPALVKPETVKPDEASYLAPQDVVYGITLNGESRAYPRKVLGWHVAVNDTIAGMPILAIDSTPSGTVKFFEARVAGQTEQFAPSGFVVRSSILFYDQKTHSLWSTFTGRAVVGPQAASDSALRPLPFVVSTWREWRRRHPGTRVLAQPRGLHLDYSERAAYGTYRQTEALYFMVPKIDRRLGTKCEVLGLFPEDKASAPLAVSLELIGKKNLYQGKVGLQEFVAFRDKSGAVRVYETQGQQFLSWDQEQAISDNQGRRWRLEELQLAGPAREKLARLPSQESFWFAWFAAFPDTRLVK